MSKRKQYEYEATPCDVCMGTGWMYLWEDEYGPCNSCNNYEARYHSDEYDIVEEDEVYER